MIDRAKGLAKYRPRWTHPGWWLYRRQFNDAMGQAMATVRDRLDAEIEEAIRNGEKPWDKAEVHRRLEQQMRRYAVSMPCANDFDLLVRQTLLKDSGYFQGGPA